MRLIISDNGKGIEKSVIKHIFEPYFTTKEIGKGILELVGKVREQLSKLEQNQVPDA